MRSAVVLAALAALLASEVVRAAEIVGVAKRVRGAAELIAAEGRDKLLAPGDRIAMNDIVETGRNGSALIQLLDASVFTVGPNARIRIDRFVYNPDRNQREAAISFLSGAMRFVSGRIAKDAPGAMRLATPMGTIGVRGTDAAIAVSPSSTDIVLLDPGDAPAGGALVVTTDGGDAVLSAPGDGLRLSQPGAPPIVSRWTEQDVNDLLGDVGAGARWTFPDRADAPGDGGVTITAAQCAALRREARLGAEYVPGQDVFGRPVAPAEAAGGGGEDFTITLTIDALRAAGVVAPFDGIEGQASLGEIRIEGGRAYLGGALLDPQGTDELRRLCRERLSR